MPVVTVTIRNAEYPVVCDEGEENLLHAFASKLDQRISRFAASLGKASDLRLLVMVALMMESEIQELKTQSVPAGHGAENSPPPMLKDFIPLVERLEKVALELDQI